MPIRIKEHLGRPLMNKTKHKQKKSARDVLHVGAGFCSSSRSDEPGVGFPWLSVVLASQSELCLISADWMLWAITAPTHFTDFHYSSRIELPAEVTVSCGCFCDRASEKKFIHFSCSGISKSARRSTDLLQGNTLFFIHRCTYTWQVWFDYNKLWCDCSISVAHFNT